MSNTEKTIKVMGEEWKIIFRDEDPTFEKCKAYTDYATREIIVENVKVSDDPLAFDTHSQYIDQKRVLRHELVHAFLMESGLDESSCDCEAWAINEEMVDWFARQAPKIFEVYKELNIL